MKTACGPFFVAYLYCFRLVSAARLITRFAQQIAWSGDPP